MKLTYRQKAYLLILVGCLGIFLPVIPGVVLIILGMALIADKKGRLDINVSSLTKRVKDTAANEK